MAVPEGHALVACQAPELADPTLAPPRNVEARGARDAGLLAEVLGPRPHVHLVGYSFGGVVAGPLRDALSQSHGLATKSLVLVDPMPFYAKPEDVASTDSQLLRAAKGYDTLLVKFKYVTEQAGGGGLAASTSSGDVATTAELATELRSHLPSQDAFDELTRVAQFLDLCDMTFDWDAATKLDDLPVHFFKTAGGPAHFKRRKRRN